MSAQILSGHDVADQLLASLKGKVQMLDPKLVIVQVGNNAASESYIKQKVKSCESVGLRYEHIHLPEHTTKDDLLTLIGQLNADGDVTGFIVQLPLPDELEDSVRDIIHAIAPHKDVDGFGPENLGNMFLGTDFEELAPATPSGVIQLLDHYKISIEGKHAVVVGRSNTVGKPLAMMLLNRGATVTICHSHTKNLARMTLEADILCSAVGKAKLITADMVKPGSVVIDIGLARDEDGLKGDVDFEAVKDIALAITPVPGGVGPMTVASLIRNCVRAKERQKKHR